MGTPRGKLAVYGEASKRALRAMREPDPLGDTVVREYTGTPSQIAVRLERDSSRMAGMGYAITQQTPMRGRRGPIESVLGLLTLGVFFLVVRPKDTLLVTYSRTA